MPTYSLRKHRVAALGAIAIAAVGGGCAGLATVASYSEWSIDGYQVDATLEGDTVSVVETIDWDFGIKEGRGIIRQIDLAVIDQPDVVGLENVTVETATANDELQISDHLDYSSLRVGNPNVTFTGLHRYQLGYDLTGVPDPEESDQFTFVAIGDRWEVPIEDITVRLATDFEPAGVSCSIGTAASFDECEASIDDGIVTATVPKVDPGEGVVLQIDNGPERTPATLKPPGLETDKTSDNGLGTALTVAFAAALAGAVGVFLAGWWVRRAGADRTGAVANPSEAAYATGSDGDGAAISDADASEQVTVQFAPPEGLTPAEGAVLEREKVDDAAKTAWLAQAVIDGWIELDGDPKKPTMVHTSRSDRDPAHMPAPLGVAFNGRREVELGEYDKSFAAGWKAIDGQLKGWQRWSGLWDERRQGRNTAIALILLGVSLVAVTVVGIALASGLGRSAGAAVGLAAGAGLLFGAGLRAAFGIRTLAVRSPAGFGLWLRTEGFRRFLAESEGQHARWAADHGLLREYSAWAVALGELDHWNQAAAQAGIPPTDPGLTTTTAFVGLSIAARTTSVQPSSGGSGFSGGGGGFSGGGFSGGVGGGGGGGW